MAASAVANKWEFGAPVTALTVNREGNWIAAALADGSFRLLPASTEKSTPQELKVHKGVSLCLAADADEHGFLSGGDDGCVYIIEPSIDAPTLLAEHKGKWIDQVASSSEGSFRAYSAGKEIRLLENDGSEKFVTFAPSSVGGLGFSPNGKRLAASHYNGISLYWTNAKDAVPTKLVWKGSHLGVVWHPDGKTVLTSMQEASLHGWRLSDNKEMQMQGYAAKVHSMEFTPKARYLATSGAEQAICWPFFGGGPWNKSPLTLGGSDGKLVSRVATHPRDELVAAGYEDGMIILAPCDGRMEMLIHPAISKKDAAVTGLVWSGDGECLFASLENGYLLLFTLDSVRQFAKQI